jgi:DNA-cytosine methyltransferase
MGTNKKYNVFSCFDGMSCGQIALKRIGIHVDNYFASEIDKYAMKVTKANYPNTKFIGNIEDIKSEDLPKIDLMLGGSPCQGFSFAGKQLNFDDPRSALFFEFVRLLKEIKPKHFLLENVRMKKEYQDVISSHLGVNPICINSSLVSGQNRVRLYWTNIKNISQPKDMGITWGDVREDGVNEQCFYYTEKAMQWLGIESRRKGKKLTVHANKDKMQMLEASHHKKYSSQRFFGIVDLPTDKHCVGAMRGRYIINGSNKNKAKETKQFLEFRYDGKTNALTTVSKDNVVVPFTLSNRVPVEDFFFRYITPLECERLQTVKDGYTDHVSNTQRYKMLGNGWTVDVISHILKNIKDDKMERKELAKIINHIKPGIQGNASLELLSHFYFSGKELVSYNDKISVLFPCKTEFTAFVKATDLSNIVNRCKDDIMKLSISGKKLNIRTKSMNVNLATLQDEELGKRLESVSESLKGAKWFTLPKNFSECVRLCAFASSKNEADQTLTCVKLGGERCYASDNMRIAKAVLSKKIKPMLIKASEIKNLTGINPTKYSGSNSWLHFKNDDGCIFSIRKVKGKFPDFEPFFDFEGTSINLPKELLVGADLASIFVDAIAPSINISIEKGKCVVSVKSDSGTIQHKSKIKYKGKPIKFSINPDFIKEMMSHSSNIVVSNDRARLDTENFSLLTTLFEN